MAQKTGLGKGGGEWEGPPVEDVIDPSFDEEDRQNLGLEGGSEPFTPDPTGYQATGPVHTVAGRKMIKLSPKELEAIHNNHAPGESMVRDPFRDQSDRKVKTKEELEEEERELEEGMESIRGQTAEELLKNFAAGKSQSTSTPTSSQETKNKSTSEKQPPAAQITVSPGEVGEAVRVVEALIAKSARSRREGDLKTASELTDLARSIIDAGKIKRVQKQQERHPALQKLLHNLGLEKIKPVMIDWMGSKWVFAPRPEELDIWVAENVAEGGLDLSSCLIAASCVGLGVDEEGAPPPDPLWKVLNIGLSATYTMEKESSIEGVPSDEKEYSVQVYYKVCESCAVEVPVQSEVCEVCGAKQDAFEVPIELRRRYAVLMKSLLKEKLGLGNKEMGDLVSKMRQEMKDRRLDKEELYPLALPLFKPETTPG